MRQTITSADLRQFMKSPHPPQLIDVRSPGEFASGHVPGAVNIPMEQLESRLDDVGAQAVLICQGGTRAKLSAEWIGQQRNPLILEGGTDAWQSAGYPVVTCVPCRWSLERQVRLGAGLMVLTGTILSLLLESSWVFLAMFAGAGLTFAGLTNICGMGMLLARMPWNQNSKMGKPASAPNCCS
jgi:rhodanese-related sulfurtransferase